MVGQYGAYAQVSHAEVSSMPGAQACHAEIAKLNIARKCTGPPGLTRVFIGIVQVPFSDANLLFEAGFSAFRKK
jgi:hypothetical protein